MRLLSHEFKIEYNSRPWYRDSIVSVDEYKLILKLCKYINLNGAMNI